MIFSFFNKLPSSKYVGNGFTVHYRKRRFWKQIEPIARVGIPFMFTIGLGTFFLYRVSKGRYEMRDRHHGAVTHSSIKKKEAKPFSLEEEYEKMQSQFDLSKWENKRIPRPGE